MESPPPSSTHLFIDPSEWAEIKARIPADPVLEKIRDRILETAGAMLDLPPLQRKMEGRRLLTVSRTFLKRALFLGAARQLTGDAAFGRKLIEETQTVAAFKDWNPPHFLDTAEMALGMAVALDWGSGDLSNELRGGLEKALLEKGLMEGLESKPHSYWYHWGNNWNQVCFCGMLAAALVLRHRHPEMLQYYLGHAEARIWHALEAYTPDGAYVEGPVYWNYGTDFSVMTIEMLRRNLGHDMGIAAFPGFLESARAINLTRGPSGLCFNHSDGGPRVSGNPALFWFARETGDHRLSQAAEEVLGKSVAENDRENRLFPLGLLWREVNGDDGGEPWPLDWRARGSNPVAVQRASWESDSLFVAIKGGCPTNNHGHMDAGSFVVDGGGVRWAEDLGAQDYHSIEKLALDLWGKTQKSDRWKIFRIGHESHNILHFGADGQLVDRFAPLAMEPRPGMAHPEILVDLSSIYSDKARRVIRSVQLLNNTELRVLDSIEGMLPNATPCWQWLTRAKIGTEAEGRQVLMNLEGRTARLSLASDTPGKFTCAPADPPPHSYDSPNPGLSRITLIPPPEGNALRLDIRFQLD